MGKLLIVNADDLGWSPEVNRGIIDSHHNGVVTSTTLMTTLPGADDAVERLKDCPDLAVGVHLTLNAGTPVCGDPAVRHRLAPNGPFRHSLVGLLYRARTQSGWRRTAQMELRAQIRWMLDRGVRPDHIDSHKHFHVVRPFDRMVLELARSFGIQLIRNTCERPRVPLGKVPAASRVRRWLLLHWGRRASVRFTHAGLVQPETLFGIEDTGRPNPDRVRHFLEVCPAQTVEWMVHPGGRESHSPVPTRLTESREAEKKMLTDPQLRGMIQSCGYRLATFGDLLG